MNFCTDFLRFYRRVKSRAEFALRVCWIPRWKFSYGFIVTSESLRRIGVMLRLSFPFEFFRGDLCPIRFKFSMRLRYYLSTGLAFAKLEFFLCHEFITVLPEIFSVRPPALYFRFFPFPFLLNFCNNGSSISWFSYVNEHVSGVHCNSWLYFTVRPLDYVGNRFSFYRFSDDSEDFSTIFLLFRVFLILFQGAEFYDIFCISSINIEVPRRVL